MIEHETRDANTMLAYGKWLTKPKARKLGVKWASAVSDSLADQHYEPSQFEEMWYPEEEEEETEQPSIVSLYQKLLDIFCKLFVHEE